MSNATLPPPPRVPTPPQVPRQDAQEPGRTPASRPPAPFPVLDAAHPFPGWEGRSALGRFVRLTGDGLDYPGAAPFYTISYAVRAGGRAQVTRYTPHRHRAQAVLLWFLHDVTDPETLGTLAPAVVGTNGTAR